MTEFEKKIKNVLQDCFFEQLGGVMNEEGNVELDDDAQKEIESALKDYANEVTTNLSTIVYDIYDSLQLEEEE